MGISSVFNVGVYQVNRQAVNPALIRNMANSAGNIKIEGNASPEAWSELADRVEANDCVSREDLRQIQDLGRACFKYHRALHNDFRASGYKDKTIKAELADVHVFRSGSDQIRESLALTQAQLAVDAAAGASFGPTSLVANYAAYSDLQKSALEPLVDNIQGLRDGTSPNLYQGNSIESFHGAEIWKEMNTMLDEATAQAKAGHPQEIDAQYYELTSPEIVGKLAQAAEAGNKVRVNVDPGRLVAFAGDHVVIDEVPDKLKTLIQLSQVKGDVAVSTYPISKQLKNASNLMHRKGLRVGEKFLLSGMNANAGSGENIDAGYTIEGPAAKRLVENFKRDVGHSIGASNEEVYGDKPLAGFMEGDINMGTRGLISMFDCVSGPSPAGTEMPKATNAQQLADIAKSMGQNVSDYTDCPLEEIDSLLKRGQDIPLSAKGKEAFLGVVQRALDITRSPENVAKLQDIDIPTGDPKGTTAIALADLPNDRRAAMIQAIQDAEEFIYVPAFVMTKSVASVLVAKRDEMKAQGKDIDIRVVADSGIYPDGGTPNEGGLKFLEDHGIDVRWTLLPRSSNHDRKVHAKEILTDKGEFFGSTNFSNKGMGVNWEHSGYVKFNPDDEASVSQHENAKAHFLNLWDNESFGLNTKDAATKRKRGAKGQLDYEVQVEEARSGVVRETIRGIQNFEKASADFIGKLVGSDPQATSRIEELVLQGYDQGSATLMAAKEKMGDEAFYNALHSLPAYEQLQQMK